MKKNKLISGKVIFFFLMVVFLWIAVSYFGQTKKIVTVLAEGEWYWIVLAVLVQLCFYPFYAGYVEKVFNIFRVKLSRQQILPIYIASKFTDVALPIATVGQVAIFLRNARRNGNEPLNVGIGISFVLLMNVASFTLLAFLILAVMAIFGHLSSVMLITFSILCVIMLLALLFIIRVAIQQKPLNRLFLTMIKVVARVTGQKKVKIEDVRQIIAEAGADLRQNLDQVWPCLGKAVVTHLINIVTLAIVYVAFVGHFDVLAVAAAYIANLLFTIVSITPQGVGVAETVMISTLHSFNLDISTAAVVTLAFRGLLYWLPLFPGFYFFSHLELKPEN